MLFDCRDPSRFPSEIKSKDYLKHDFREMLYRGPVKYKLQLTLHIPRSDDPPEILNISRYWDEAAHPWLDVADVKMGVFLSPEVTEKLHFNPANLPACLEVLPARSIHHSNCLVHIRKDIYERTRKMRLLRGINYVADRPATYTISVETGRQSRAGTDANISVLLTGKQTLDVHT